ncbi:early nodulin-like protein 1 [Dendrobium catenatum]|uniref:Early nodulin-like protein 1 n=1 Tax=Dendrobium catenatum TaxID=906689 RepID=A0A2I0WSR3_9ASPA|nr:early nodulin-like protein 1 [Dendrobium catenatum]PKU78687.1 Early nodulin-like protein 1 [Dendrobium catenatum]
MEVTLLVSFKLLLFFSLFSISSLLTLSTDFAVGGDGDWAIPSSKDPDFYNKWAAKNRFKVDDTINFKYNKDSVLVVTESEYDKCRSMHPIFFSNNGKTEFKFERAGLFYFISGVNGHCERGERMIIKVITGPNASPPDQRNDTDSSDSVINDLHSTSLTIFLLTVGNLALALGFN